MRAVNGIGDNVEPVNEQEPQVEVRRNFRVMQERVNRFPVFPAPEVAEWEVQGAGENSLKDRPDASIERDSLSFRFLGPQSPAIPRISV